MMNSWEQKAYVLAQNIMTGKIDLSILAEKMGWGTSTPMPVDASLIRATTKPA